MTCPDLHYGDLLYEVQHKSTFDSQWQASGRGVLGGGGAEGLVTLGFPVGDRAHVAGVAPGPWEQLCGHREDTTMAPPASAFH